MAKNHSHKKRKHAPNAKQFGYNNNKPKVQVEIEKFEFDKHAKGDFDFDTYHGFPLVEMEYKSPPKKEREETRNQFRKEARPAFLKYIAEHFPDQLRAIGVTEKGLELMKSGQSANGFNVHHKVPIHGGGSNDFSNLILMPIKQHDDLHQKIIDPQIRDKSTKHGTVIKLPYNDKMVWERPSQEKQKTQTATMKIEVPRSSFFAARAKLKSGGR